MSQLGRFDHRVPDTLGNAISGASVTIYREGATVVSGSGTSPLTVTCRHRGKIAAADTVFINTTTGTTYSVDSVTATTVVISGFGGTLTLTAGDRIIPSNSQPTLYGDDQGGATTTNPLTTSATGRAQCFIEPGPYDVIVSGGGATTTLFVSQQVGPFTEPISVFNVRTYGAVGDGVTNDYAAIQAAIDDAESVGAGEIFVPAGTYLLGTGLTLEDADLRIRGSGRGSILKANSAITMLTVGPGSGALTANAGNIVSSLMFDFNSTASTGIKWNRWGQIGWTEHIHFVNPIAGSIGITTEDSDTVNELVFQDINWFYNPPLSGGAAVGTGIIIDCNNCKILDSTIIGATVGIDITTTTSADPLIIAGNRLRANTRGIRANAQFNKGLVIRDNRFEGNTIETYAIDLEGLDATTNRINGVVISGNRFSSTNGIRLKNIKGCLIEGCLIASTFTPAPTTFITDGGGVSELSTVNLLNGEGVSLAHFPSTITDVEATGPATGLYNILRRTQFGDGTDAPTTTNALVYITRAGEAHFVCRDSTNNAEGLFGSSGSIIRIGSRTAHPVNIMTNANDRASFLSDGTFEFGSAGFGLTDGITAPSTKAGVAYIYVDTIDGDLKVKFGDGFVRVIGADS